MVLRLCAPVRLPLGLCLWLCVCGGVVLVVGEFSHYGRCADCSPSLDVHPVGANVLRETCTEE